MKKLTIAALLVSSVLTGCATFPDHYDKPLGAEAIQGQKKDEWGSMAPVTFVQSNAGLAVRKYNEIPESLLNKRLRVRFERGVTPTLPDVTYVLGQQGFRVVTRLDEETPKKAWPVRELDGTVADVLRDIEATYNVGSEFRNGTLYLVESNKYSAALPQHKEFLAAVATALKELGATDVRADILAGQVYYSAKPDLAENISEYLAAVSKNAAMVTLQVAVLTVGMDRDVNLGFDWARFAVARGSGGMRQDLSSIFSSASTSSGTTTGTTGTTGTSGSSSGSSSTSTSNSTTPTTTGSTTTGTTVKELVTGSLLSFAGSEGFGYKFANNAFSLTAAIKALSTYGNARTEQNVILGTLSGLPVKINSGDDIPYVKSIGSATASGGATTGSTTTEVIKSGLKLEVTPNFDSSDGTVVTQVKVEMSTLVGMIQLNAGNNLGTLSQPQMKNLGFENVGRLNAGETIIVGGITYDQITNSYTNFPGMEKLPLGSKAEKTSRNAMYIVVRPTVVVFTPKAREFNEKLRALEEASQAALNAANAQTEAATVTAGKPASAPVSGGAKQ